MRPGRYDITIYQRATYPLQVKLPIDLTGHEVLAQIWDDKRRRKYADFDVEIIDAAEGTVKLSLDPDVTKELKKEAVWDLMVVYDNGDKDYWLEGNVTIDPGYTDSDTP